MNIDQALANRVFAGIGDDPLTPADYVGESLRFRVLKDFYLQTFLEALSEVPWTRGKKRAVLSKLDADNLSPYRFQYALPIDCARPLEIQDNAYFVAEGDRILTDRDDAALLYITNGKVAGKVSIICYASDGDAIFDPEPAEPFPILRYPASYLDRDDYPDYDPPEYEPKFYEYIERLLAAKLSVKLQKSPKLYETLFSSAMLIKREAIAASRSAAAAKKNGNDWWFDRLGIRYG
jgi:hypothetical protein